MISFSKQMKQQRQVHRGFTLIEVLVSAVIFATSLATLLVIVGTGIGDVNVAKNKLTANYLAQEGIELMRYKRDYLVETQGATAGWAAFTGPYTNGNGCDTGSCGVTALDPAVAPIACTPATTCLLVTNSESVGNGAYDFVGDFLANPSVSSWAPTIFSRYVYVTQAANFLGATEDALVIHSVVTWSQGTGTYQTSMSETLYNWY
jgi:prepilin-type N-terminal cleavage/methylation domain-containing protein